MRDTYRVGPRVTVLVVADIDVPMAHGFVPRYEALIASLRRRAEVTVVGISPKIETVLPRGSPDAVSVGARARRRPAVHRARRDRDVELSAT